MSELKEKTSKILSGVAAGVGKVAGEAVVRGKEIGEKAQGFADINNDGKIDDKDVIELLNIIYGKSINGIAGVSEPIGPFSDEYLKKYDAEKACKKMMRNAIIKCTTSGVVTGFGGLITLPVTLPANVTSVLYVQMRMIASAAYMAGLDVNDDAVQTLVYACLAGVNVAEYVKKAGIVIGEKVAVTAVKRIPGKAITAINKKVGFRLLTKFGEKGVVNLGKMVPVVGAAVSGGFDLAETKIIANRAYKEFFEGDFEIKDKEEVLDVEFEEVDETEHVPEKEYQLYKRIQNGTARSDDFVDFGMFLKMCCCEENIMIDRFKRQLEEENKG